MAPLPSDLPLWLWLEASLLTGFSQYSPVDGIAAADSTEVLVMYTDYAAYFGIRAFETHGPVHASHADRDKIGADDHVQLLLDTFRDRRRAYSIAVNPLGIQSDGIFSDNSGADLNPDFQFESMDVRGRRRVVSARCKASIALV